MGFEIIKVIFASVEKNSYFLLRADINVSGDPLSGSKHCIKKMARKTEFFSKSKVN